MNWAWWLIVAGIAFVGLKLFLKTMKFLFIFAIIALLAGAFFLWQNGMLPLK